MSRIKFTPYFFPRIRISPCRTARGYEARVYISSSLVTGQNLCFYVPSYLYALPYVTASPYGIDQSLLRHLLTRISGHILFVLLTLLKTKRRRKNASPTRTSVPYVRSHARAHTHARKKNERDGFSKRLQTRRDVCLSRTMAIEPKTKKNVTLLRTSHHPRRLSRCP